jgi:pimeloyl-[acyl-carrier protein] methyl ester esterase
VFERGEPAPPVLVDGLALLADSDLRPLLPGLPVPSLWLAGRRDRLVDWRAMEAAAALAPRARFHRIDGGGHAPFLGHAEDVAAQVHAFGSDLPA